MNSIPQKYIDLMPRWLGEVAYPNGMPVHTQAHHYEGRTVADIYYSKTMSEEEKEFIKAYLLYYVNAPYFADSETITEQLLSLDEIDDMIMACLNHGLDPL